MKEVQLYKIESDKALIGGHLDVMRIHQLDDIGNRMVMDTQYDEFLVNSRVEVEDIPIRRIVRNNHEYYVAVTSNVWETLCMFDNPVTVESLQKKNRELEEKTRKQSIWICEVSMAKWWVRLKWLFTGVVN